MRRVQRTYRIRAVAGTICLVAFLLIVRSYVVQIMHGEQYSDQAKSQYTRTTSELYDRGSIYFSTRDGAALSAAAIKSGYVLALNPSRITDPVHMCREIIQVVEIDEELCLFRATLENRTYVEFSNDLNDAAATRLAEKELTGVSLHPNQWRFYPGGTVAARSIGFVGFTGDGTDVRGKYGLERQYDDVLYREDQVRSVNFFADVV